MSKKFIQVVVNNLTNAEMLADISEQAFAQFNCGGSQVFDFDEQQVDNLLGKEAYVGGELPQSIIDKIDNAHLQENDAHFFFFFTDTFKKDSEGFLDFIKSKSDLTVSSEEKNWDDWNKEWQKHYHPIIISDLLQVHPAWEKKSNDTSNHIWINPGMGFGTGTHETTFLCLEFFGEMLDLFSKEKISVLDLGCGSGILGIAAKKFISCDVDFCDIDLDALDNCVENIKINFEDGQLEGSTVCSRRRFKIIKEYDLIFANILEPVLLEEQKSITALSKIGTELILSGVLDDQYQNIINHYQQDGWKMILKKQKNSWVALHLKKES